MLVLTENASSKLDQPEDKRCTGPFARRELPLYTFTCRLPAVQELVPPRTCVVKAVRRPVPANDSTCVPIPVVRA